MFYNAPTRRKAMKGAGEEYGKLLQVVQPYGVDNPGVAFSCKKAGESAADLHTAREHGTRDTLRQTQGAALAKELLEVDGADAELGLAVKGQVTGANWAAKKPHFLLFINKASSSRPRLKRALDDVYATMLPKGAHPFVYLSLRLPPAALDVNVHPTKREVFFLHQERLVAAVQAIVREKLRGANAGSSRLSRRPSVPGMVAGAHDGTGGGGIGSALPSPATAAARAGARLAKPQADPRKLVRTNDGMAAGELEKYVCRGAPPSSAAAAAADPDAAADDADANRRRGMPAAMPCTGRSSCR